MPVTRYFLFVGAALLILLFAVDLYLPKLPSAERTRALANLSAIRIHSDRKWPEPVVFDTTRPTIAPATTGTVQANAPVQAEIADLPAKVRVREAFAQLTPNQLQTVDPRKPERKPQRKHKNMTRGTPRPPTILAAQQPRFGLFGNGIW